MNLKLVSIAAVAGLVAISFAPASFAAAAATKTPAAASSTMKPAMKTASSPDSKQFKTEAEASATCPSDTVVWANFSSKIFHLKGTTSYGKTKRGAYMCETDAKGEGFNPTKKPEKMASAMSSMKAKPAATTSK